MDVAIDTLRKHGVMQALFKPGGDLRVLEPCLRNIVLRDARDPRRNTHQLTLFEQALAASARYARPIRPARC